jgi:hypothetical protein
MVIKEIYLACDYCTESFGVEKKNEWHGANDLRFKAGRAGWVRTEGKDCCLKCVRAFNRKAQ